MDFEPKRYQFLSLWVSGLSKFGFWLTTTLLKHIVLLEMMFGFGYFQRLWASLKGRTIIVLTSCFLTFCGCKVMRRCCQRSCLILLWFCIFKFSRNSLRPNVISFNYLGLPHLCRSVSRTWCWHSLLRHPSRYVFKMSFTPGIFFLWWELLFF